MNTTDPVELIVATALTNAGIAFTHESDNKRQTLDFHLVDFGVDIECKQFPSKRTAAQIVDHPNVIVIQGRKAAEWFAKMISASRG
jgi:hypothetical protein